MGDGITIENYDEFVRQTARVKEPLWYAALGIAGETGEVVEKIKKIVRDKESRVSDEDRDQLKKELGDVLWYVTRLAQDLGVPLQEVFNTNVVKLTHRMIHGKEGVE